jgi:hypothetical protein
MTHSGSACLVDSSKDLSWLETQARVCARNGWRLDIVLCIKDLEAIALSHAKRSKSLRYLCSVPGAGSSSCFDWRGRSRFADLVDATVAPAIRMVASRKLAAKLSYYQAFRREFGDGSCVVVDTDRLVRDPAAVSRRLCEALDVPYFAGKENYWNFRHDYRFGSQTQCQQVWHGERCGFWVGEPNPVSPVLPSHILPPRLLALGDRLRRMAVDSGAPIDAVSHERSDKSVMAPAA